jgi:hypothetical protein
MRFLVVTFVSAVAVLVVAFLWGWIGRRRGWTWRVDNQPFYPATLCTWQQLVKIILMTLLILIFVGTTEFCFLRFVGINYRTADPNLVKRNVVRAMRDYGGLPALGGPGAPTESEARPECP